MGPVKNYWMMPFEMKHKCFNDHVRKMNNFVNLTKRLAYEHQRMMLNYEDSFEDQYEVSKLKNVPVNDELISMLPSSAYNFNDFIALNFLKLNGIEYRKSFILCCNNHLFEIVAILHDKCNTFVFACNQMIVRNLTHFVIVF